MEESHKPQNHWVKGYLVQTAETAFGDIVATIIRADRMVALTLRKGEFVDLIVGSPELGANATEEELAALKYAATALHEPQHAHVTEL